MNNTKIKDITEKILDFLNLPNKEKVQIQKELYTITENEGLITIQVKSSSKEEFYYINLEFEKVYKSPEGVEELLLKEGKCTEIFLDEDGYPDSDFIQILYSERICNLKRKNDYIILTIESMFN